MAVKKPFGTSCLPLQSRGISTFEQFTDFPYHKIKEVLIFFMRNTMLKRCYFVVLLLVPFFKKLLAEIKGWLTPFLT